MSEFCFCVVEEESEDDATITSWRDVECFSGLECGDGSDAIMTDVLMCLQCRMMGWSDSLDMGKKIIKKKLLNIWDL